MIRYFERKKISAERLPQLIVRYAPDDLKLMEGGCRAMKKISFVLWVFCLSYLCCPSLGYAAAWDQCKGCHNGNVAPDEKSLKLKFPTVKKFVEAAKKSDDPFMIGFQSDEKLLKEAAQEIGLK